MSHYYPSQIPLCHSYIQTHYAGHFMFPLVPRTPNNICLITIPLRPHSAIHIYYIPVSLWHQIIYISLLSLTAPTLSSNYRNLLCRSFHLPLLHQIIIVSLPSLMSLTLPSICMNSLYKYIC